MKRLGVLGTLVRDTIRHPAAPGPVRAWGGIAYALAAFEVALPNGWSTVPIVKIGGDLYARATSFIRSFTRVGDSRFLHMVPEPNNRVELVYANDADRLEILSGGVPGWAVRDVGEFLKDLDALYVNFISGMELTLSGARRIRDGLAGPSHADLHSLFLGVESDGRRVPRYLRSSEEWAGCFDTVQMNEDEFAMFSRGAADPVRAAASAFEGRLRMIAVTRGSEGVKVIAARRDGDPNVWDVPTSSGPASSEPTGCGDVWGAAFFSGALAGADRGTAITYAHALARCKLRCRGADETRRHLAEEGPRPPWSSR
ncbi:MAG: carbohydrate kinase family protein [Gemmatimonadetes bacterium]|nr:carbohydrate kinase family protein [Gemmatimonadota bacterium]